MKVYILSKDNIFLYLTKRSIEKIPNLHYDNNFFATQDLIIYITQNHSDMTSVPIIILVDFDNLANESCSFLNEISKIKPDFKDRIHLYACTSFIPSNDILEALENNIILDYFTKPLNHLKWQKIVDRSYAR
ncbi:hypothetical protein DHD05_06265 [Arenibacter sp. N53]|uniref:hypothetical protein n=1 Tax=Arenibacter TaxID=178469 RepID=UPI000CD45F75|nr:MULTISPECIES: hypothetical protein [Arenibacter]MCM4151190.1 hypothetical protein [Arenibacter sp. N53]